MRVCAQDEYFGKVIACGKNATVEASSSAGPCEDDDATIIVAAAALGQTITGCAQAREFKYCDYDDGAISAKDICCASCNPCQDDDATIIVAAGALGVQVTGCAHLRDLGLCSFSQGTTSAKDIAANAITLSGPSNPRTKSTKSTSTVLLPVYMFKCM